MALGRVIDRRKPTHIPSLAFSPLRGETALAERNKVGDGYGSSEATIQVKAKVRNRELGDMEREHANIPENSTYSIFILFPLHFCFLFSTLQSFVF